MGSLRKNSPNHIPYLTVRNTEESIEFYKNSFGFTVKDIAKDPKGNLMYIEMQKDALIIRFFPEKLYGTATRSPASKGINSPINFPIYCKDINNLYDQAIKNGAIPLYKPSKAFWGEQFCKVADPDGYEWLFATNKRGISQVF